jgi:hypothetical protein
MVETPKSAADGKFSEDLGSKIYPCDGRGLVPGYKGVLNAFFVPHKTAYKTYR